MNDLWEDTTLALEDRILEYVQRHPTATFAELTRRLPDIKGEYGLELGDTNILLWPALTEQAIAAFKKLMEDNRIIPNCEPMLIYLVDGMVPSLPVAKRIRKRGYKKLHWLPVSFSVPRGPSLLKGE